MKDDFFSVVGTQTGGEVRPAYDDGPRRKQLRDDIAPMQGTLNIRRWARSDDIFWPAADTCERLEAGFYVFDSIPSVGAVLRRTSISTDGLLHLPDTVGEKVVEEFKTFWQLRDKFVKRGFLHKRGILLHGPAGSGKTTSLMLMAHEIIERYDGIVCQVDQPQFAAMCLGFVRKIEPERPIVAFLEDIDALVQTHGEAALLALLDGETQVDRICYIATTNYPEKLDRRFVDRPSRFDTIEYIGMPTDAARRVYLKTKEPSLTDDELEEWVQRTPGFSIAHLRELVILVKCFERSLDHAIARLEKMRVKPSSEDSPDKMKMGIGPWKSTSI